MSVQSHKMLLFLAVTLISVMVLAARRYHRFASLASKVYSDEENFVRGDPSSIARVFWTGIVGAELSGPRPRGELIALQDCAGGIAFLRARGPSLDDAALVELRRFVALRRVDVSRSLLTDEAIDWLSRLNRLESVDLSESQVSDEGLLSLQLAVDGRVRITATHLDALPPWIDSETIRVVRSELGRKIAGGSEDSFKPKVLGWRELTRHSADLSKDMVDVRLVCFIIDDVDHAGNGALVAVGWDSEVRRWGPLEIVDGPAAVWVLPRDTARRQAVFFLSQMLDLGWPIEDRPGSVIRRRTVFGHADISNPGTD